MKITKTFEITLDEPTPHWLCADNLHLALQAYCPYTQFKIVETKRVPEYPEPKPSEITITEHEKEQGWYILNGKKMNVNGEELIMEAEQGAAPDENRRAA